MAITAIAIAVEPVATTTLVPRDFFGLHVNGGAPTALTGGLQIPIPSLGQHGIRLQNARTEWRDLNPRPGVFDWRILDARVAQDHKLGLTTMLVLGGPPNWVMELWLQPDLLDRHRILYRTWVDYITAVARRYGNRIEYYELWNEPDVGGFKGGTLAEMLELARLARPILKHTAPRSKLISPGFSLPVHRLLPLRAADPPVTLASFMEAGGGQLVDLVSVHAYPGDGNAPETLTARLRLTRSIVDAAGLPGMQILDSESGARGWRDSTRGIHNIPPHFGEPLPTAPVDLQSAYVSRTLLVIAASGVVRQSYYFTFDNGDNAGGRRSVMAVVMTSAASGGTLRRPALAYRYLAQLLPGARLGPVQQVGEHWELDIVKARRHVRAYWCDDDRQDMLVLPAATEVRDVVGAALQHERAAIKIDASPIFVFSREANRGPNDY